MGDYTIKVGATFDDAELQGKLNALINQKINIPINFETGKGADKIKNDLNALSKTTKLNIDSSSLDKAASKLKDFSKASQTIRNFNTKEATGGLDKEMESLNSQISKLESQSQSSKSTEAIRKQVSELRAEYEQLSEMQQKASEDLHTAGKDLTDDNTKSAESSIEKYNAGLKTVQNQAQTLKAELSGIGDPLKELANFQLKIDTGGLDSDMSKWGTEISKLQTQITQSSGTDSLKNDLESVRQSYEQLKIAQRDVFKAQGSGNETQMVSSMDAYNKQLQTVQNQVQTLKAEFSNLSPNIKEMSNFQFKFDTGSLQTDLSQIDATISKLESQTMAGAGTEELQSQVASLRSEYEQLQQAQSTAIESLGSGDALQATVAIDNYNMKLKQLQNDAKQTQLAMSEMVSPLQRINLTNQIETWLQNNTKATKEAKEQLQGYVDTMNQAGSSLTTGEFNKIQTQFKNITAEQTAMGNTGQSWLTGFERAFSRIGQFTGIYRVTSQIPRVFMGLANNVLEVNSALIELRKVSDATDVELSNSFEHATESAQEYGASISEIINSQADWARLGYTVPEAEELADTTTLLQTVGDNMTQESSSEGLIAVLRGFQYDASQAEEIVDIVNEVAKLLAKLVVIRGVINPVDNYIGQIPEVVKTEQRFIA